MRKSENAYDWFGSTLMWITVVFCSFSLGCFAEPNGVYCITDDDCTSQNCYSGVCVGDPVDAEFDSAGENGHRVRKVDVLIVVDNSNPLTAQPSVLSAGVFTLLNELQLDPTGDAADSSLDVRLAVTNSDMGISYQKGEDTVAIASDSTCRGVGNNGRMITSYVETGSSEIVIPIQGQMIECQNDDSACPGDWVCTLMNQDGNGVCTPVYDSTMVSCPKIESFLSENMYLTPGSSSSDFGGSEFTDYLTASACLSSVGFGGCWMAQPFHATVAALTKHGQQIFLRKDAVTLIIVVSNDDDCSLQNSLSNESNETPSSMALCRNEELLVSPSAVKKRMIAAKTDEIGENAADSIVFAAFAGVPTVPTCQGAGDVINECGAVALPNGGTVDTPAIVQFVGVDGEMESVEELACERKDESGGAVTQAHGANRIVRLTQLFGESGFMYSICNEDWTPAMKQIARMVVTKSELRMESSR